MSWFDDLVDLGKSAFSWFTGDSVGASLARTAVTGYALNRVTSSIQKDNAAASSGNAATDTAGTRVQVNPNPEYKIPVVYGTAVLGGTITDAQLSSDNQLMYYCITLSEKTGPLNLGQGPASEFFLDRVWWNENELRFSNSGATAGNLVTSMVDSEGNVDDSINGLVGIYFYDGNSSSPRVITGYTNGSQPAAYSLMPQWNINYAMNNLVFAIVIVQYNAEKNITGLGDVKFKIRNTMNQPGDCLYDYMTNTIYGAGIPAGDINGL